jgi:fluoride exporter
VRRHPERAARHRVRRWTETDTRCYRFAVHYVVVFLGGGLGAALRHGVNRASLAYLAPTFPWGTLFVNIVGGLLMGVLAELFLVKGGGSQELRLFLITGVLGGFTTFSAFSLDAGLMWQRSDYASLAIYVIGSVVLSIAALFVGMVGVRALT